MKHIPKKLRCWLSLFLGDCSKVVRYWEWAQGFHQVEQNQLYVNRGLGTYRPGRLFCPPEVTVITLVSVETNSTKAETVTSYERKVSVTSNGLMGVSNNSNLIQKSEMTN